MNILELDARQWKTPADFYNALLRKLGAPDWHGTSINAFIDSMIVGDINEVTSPLRVVASGLQSAGEPAFDALTEVFSALARCGAVAHITSDRASLDIPYGVYRFLDDQT